MKVALVLWPICQAGGLTTDVLHYATLLKRAGHVAKFYKINYSGQVKLGQPMTFSTGADGPTVKQNEITVHNRYIDKSIRLLNRYDSVVFVHPCPHTTDRAKAVANWWRAYEEVFSAKKVYFTDIYLEKLYPWIKDVADRFESYGRNTAILRNIEPHIPGAQLGTYAFAWQKHGIHYEKELDVMWPNAWRGWKGIKPFVEAVPEIQGTVELYGSGRERRQLKKVKNEVALNSKGIITPHKMIKVIKKSRMLVDLTGQSKTYYGHYNRSTLEGMWFGTITVLRNTMVAPHSPIPKECALVIEDNSEIAPQINSLLRSPKRQKKIAQSAYDWVREFASPDKALGEILR